MSVAERLGYPADARLVVAHVDDVGMCHGANTAFAELSGKGFITCGSVMPPCPWMLEAVDMAKARPELDLGVHLTLTSEWKHYRWRPFTGSTRASGLVDEDGYFWRSAGETIAHADLTAVEEELWAQIEAVTSRGLTPSHVDCHMGTALAPAFADIFFSVCAAFALTPLMPRDWNDYLSGLHMEGPEDNPHAARVTAFEAKGRPVIDHFVETPWLDEPGQADAAYKALIEGLQPGLSFMALHPNSAGDIEVIDPPRCHCRTDEVRIFQSEWFLEHLRHSGIQLLSFRDLVQRLEAAG
ncbi:MAG: polysaccharide deacetylase family protein [Pseudomonadota bacterium]